LIQGSILALLGLGLMQAYGDLRSVDTLVITLLGIILLGANYFEFQLDDLLG